MWGGWRLVQRGYLTETPEGLYKADIVEARNLWSSTARNNRSMVRSRGWARFSVCCVLVCMVVGGGLIEGGFGYAGTERGGQMAGAYVRFL